jgi:hypothetical protein
LTASISPTLTAHVDASFTDYNNVAGAHFISSDFQAWAVAANLVWEAAPGLTMGPEVAFTSIDFVDAAPQTNFDNWPGFVDTDVWGVMWRVNRDFGW